MENVRTFNLSHPVETISYSKHSQSNMMTDTELNDNDIANAQHILNIWHTHALQEGWANATLSLQKRFEGFYPEGLLPGEGNVGTYSAQYYRNVRDSFADVSPHHMPSDAYMQSRSHVNYSHSRGVTMNMSHDRHQRTATYRRPPDYDLTPRQALARDLWDARRIYREDGLYISADGNVYIVGQLREVARRNRENFPELFMR